VNTARSPFVRVGVGVFSIVLGTVILLMVGGLLVADRALTRAGEEQAYIDARESALVLEQVVSAEIEGLSTFRGLMLTTESRAAAFAELAGAFAESRRGLRQVWVTDSLGRVVHDSILLTTSAAHLAQRENLRSKSISAVLSRRVPVITIDLEDADDRVAMIVTPVMMRGRLVGAAGSVFGATELLHPVLADAPETRADLVLLQGSDTLAHAVRSGTLRSLAMKQATVRLPDGGRWELHIAHSQASQGLRLTLWVLGLVAVAFLGGGVLRERRQALRVAERSAELERLSSELLRANRMKSEFLANVSHELRTPLNAIVGFVDLLRDGVYGDLSPRQVPPVDRIAASATHLRHLVDQVLDIAKIAAGRLEVHAETIVLRPFVLNVASELESLISERGLNLSIAVGASLPRVRTDPTHLRQILVNLIGNAIKYTPSGGVAVRARLVGVPAAPAARRLAPEDPTLLVRSPDRRRTWIALQVIDTGIGIAPSDQERIFDEFEQVNAGPRGDSMQRGTGLGLAISRRLARLLGGDLTVDSQPSKGSTFTIWLPVSPADIQVEAPEAREAVPHASA
jgi:two-component system sensor histidine kinase EvgS